MSVLGRSVPICVVAPAAASPQQVLLSEIEQRLGSVTDVRQLSSLEQHFLLSLRLDGIFQIVPLKDCDKVNSLKKK